MKVRGGTFPEDNHLSGFLHQSSEMTHALDENLIKTTSIR